MVYDILSKFLGYPKENYGTQLQYNCPNCAKNNFGIPDGKYNLEINLASNYKGKSCKIYNCWNCGISGFLGKLVKFYGKQFYQEYLKYDKEEFLIFQKNKKSITKLPNEFIPFSKMDINNEKHLEAYNYVHNTRLVPKRIIKQDNLGFCLEGKYADRIIIPSYDYNNNLNYFSTRLFKEKDEEKYKYPYGDKQSIIFNEKNINWNSTVFIVEAYFEYTVIPYNTIILNGKVLYDKIINNILKYKPNVIICLNPDATEKGKDFNVYKKAKSSLEIYELLLHYGLKNVKTLNYNNYEDLNKNLQLYGKKYIFELLLA